MKTLYNLICFLLCLVIVLADHKRDGKSIHEKKQFHRTSKGEQRELLSKLHSKHEAHGVRKHAPELISPHDAHLQSDLSYNRKRGHGIARDDIHLQNIQIEDPRPHKMAMHNKKHDNSKDRFLAPAANMHHRSSKMNEKKVKAGDFEGKQQKSKKRGDKKAIFPKKKMLLHKMSATKH